MVKVDYYKSGKKDINLIKINKKFIEAESHVRLKDAPGNDYMGWTNYASNFPKDEIERIKKTAKRIQDNFDILVVCGIGGSYLGSRAVIDALRPLYSKGLEIIYMGNTLSPNETVSYLNYLKDKKFAVNVISKSGTTTETAVAFRLLKQLLISQHGKDYLKEAIVATTDSSKGALKKEAETIGYETYVIPNDIGGRYSVITPVGLLPIACANLDIEKFLNGVIDGEKDYSLSTLDNPAYKYGAIRYCLNKQLGKKAEMFVTYSQSYTMIGEWLKQLFDESEGKDGEALLCTSCCFTTDLHSMGQFIQQGTPIEFETVIKVSNPSLDIEVKEDESNLDNLNYLAGKKLSYINSKAFEATLKAHSDYQTPVVVLNIDKMDEYNLGNLMYFFFKATALSAYMLNVNPFNQPGVEIYKRNMFKLLGKPGYEK